MAPTTVDAPARETAGDVVTRELAALLAVAPAAWVVLRQFPEDGPVTAATAAVAQANEQKLSDLVPAADLIVAALLGTQ